MMSLARSSLGLLGLALAAPAIVNAQAAGPSAPAGYQAPAGLDGRPAADLALPTAALALPPAQPQPAHHHKGKTLCARCAAAQNPNLAPPGRIVACAHSKNGVCTACAAALALPGEMVVMSPPSATEPPGRALASSGSTPMASPSSPALARRNSGGTASAPYDGPTGEPAPVGVVQANFAQRAPMGMAPSMAAPASAPGRAVAEAGAGPAPYRPKGRGVTNPHILGHLFGFSGIGAERADERARRKAESHAMIPYNNEGSTVDELPASKVYGRR